MTRLLIALDYDDTVTADFSLWLSFIENATRRGHEVVIVTSRTAPPHDIAHNLPGIQIHQTFGEAKKPYMERKGFKPHIWIDDNPAVLTQNASWFDGVER